MFLRVSFNKADPTLWNIYRPSDTNKFSGPVDMEVGDPR